ncbi:hypothetical protein [Pseudobutyrivibrio ruminis]|uniref:Uncharacterized protein n=1 Tax=Pseudobutyrivibrio ruminis DSM 9787 TaxID=1123011 RepID=A0A285RR85_9FIRM|nr:hypothetical protein [Pseudobutyrivibrio ruminis]SOB96560.1 hypothetical protein SAMN02910411_1115 [Pseudobutyrivibrio ruminis DSM 9787]
MVSVTDHDTFNYDLYSTLKISGDMNSDEFFLPEEYWMSQSPYKEINEERNRWLEGLKKQREEAERKKINSFLYRRPVRRGPRF